MKNLSYKKVGTDKITVKGMLSADGKTIEYEDDDKVLQTIEVTKCMKLMAGNMITFTVQLKNDQDCSGELETGKGI